MNLMSALQSALSGMSAAQAGAELVSRNVAGASTPGYTKKVLPQEAVVLDGQGAGVRTLAVQRQIDLRVQQDMWVQQGSSQRLSVINDVLTRLDQLYGKPDADASLAASVEKLATGLQDLADNPESETARQSVLISAQTMASDLNRMSASVQDMRAEADQGIADSVKAVNTALVAIDKLNDEISARKNANTSTADLEDERDRQLQSLSQYLDVKIYRQADDRVTITTGSGRLLLDNDARQLNFAAKPVIGPQDLYSNDPPSLSGITISGPDGQIDLLENNEIKSGKIGGLVELRDGLLVQAQAQLDELAGALALSLSERQGTLNPVMTQVPASDPPVYSAAALDVADIETPGDQVAFTYVDDAGTQHTMVLTAVANPDGQPLGQFEFALGATASQTAANIRMTLAAQLANPATGTSSLTVDAVDPSNPTVIGLTDAAPGAGGANGAGLVSLYGKSRTGGDIAHDELQFALFGDGGGAAQIPYTGREQIDASDPPGQKLGFAARIAVSSAVLEDSSLLVAYPTDGTDSGSALSGDSSRPLELLARLTERTRTVDPGTGLGSKANPWSGSVQQLAVNLVALQANQAADYQDQLTVQQSLTTNVEASFDSASGVNVDEEMSQLLMLEHMYSASAQIMNTVQKMLDDLMGIVR